MRLLISIVVGLLVAFLVYQLKIFSKKDHPETYIRATGVLTTIIVFILLMTGLGSPSKKDNTGELAANNEVNNRVKSRMKEKSNETKSMKDKDENKSEQKDINSKSEDNKKIKSKTDSQQKSKTSTNQSRTSFNESKRPSREDKKSTSTNTSKSSSFTGSNTSNRPSTSKKPSASNRPSNLGKKPEQPSSVNKRPIADKPNQSGQKPKEKPSQPEQKPEEKPSQPEQKPEEKPSQPEQKPEEKPSQPEKEPNIEVEVTYDYETVPYEVTYIDDDNEYIGTENVEKFGVYGWVRYEVKTIKQDGKIIDVKRKAIERREPEKEIIIRGTKKYTSNDIKEVQTGDQDLDKLVNLINKYRVNSGGYRPLIVKPKLQKAAEIRAKELEQKYSHDRPDGRPYDSVLKDVGVIFKGGGYGGQGENLTMAPDAEKAFASWVNSPGHNANMLYPRWVEIGVGRYKMNDSSDGAPSYGYVVIFLTETR